MSRKALHKIVIALFLAVAVCAEQPGSPWPVPLPQNPNPKALVSTPVSHIPVALSANATFQAGVYPGTPMPMPIPPTEVRS